MIPTDEDWRRLGRCIEERIQSRQLIKAEVLRASEMSGTTLDGYISGRARAKYRPDKLRDLSLALGWTGGSLQRVLEGGDPEELAEAGREGHGGTEGWPAWLEEKWVRLETRVDRLEEVADRWEALLPPDDPPPGRGGR